MSTNDLLERRAERGVARGAANVWADAQPTMTSQRTDRSWIFRAALFVWVVGIGLAAVLAVRDSNDIDTTSEAPGGDPCPTSDEPLPAPLLVEGMDLHRVTPPFDPNFDGDDIFDDLFGRSGEPEVFHFGERASDYSVIFADPDEPFVGPIIGLSLFDAGGFRPWSANLGDARLDDFTEQLEFKDGEWTMPPSSGLVEVARFSIDPYEQMKYGWQFDFKNGNDRVIVQAETAPNDAAAANEWLWLARVVQEGESGPLVEEVEVLGQTGIRIRMASDREDDEIVWAAGGFVYRVTASTDIGNNSTASAASSEIAKLKVVDRSDWIFAVEDAHRPGIGEVISIVVAVAILLATIGSMLFFGMRRAAKAAGICAALLVTAFATTGLGINGGVPLLAPAMLVAGLVLAWWSYQREPSSES